MANVKQKTESQNPDLSPEDEPLLPPHDDEPQLFPVYVGGVFIGYERLNPDSEEIGGQEL